MKTYLKTLTRMFQKHVTRFLSIILIVLVSVGFISGIGTSADKIKYSLTDFYKSQNISDLIVKTTESDGFSDENVTALKEVYGDDNVNTGAALDAYITVEGEKQLFRLYFFDDFDNRTVNKFVLPVQPDGDNYAYAEVSDNNIKGLPDGAQVELDFKDILTQLAEHNGEKIEGIFEMALNTLKPVTVTVQGTVKSPLTFANDGEPSWLNDEDTEIPDNINDVNELITLDNILYMPSEIIPAVFNQKVVKTTDVFLSFAYKGKFGAFGKDYSPYVDAQKEVILDKLGADSETVKFVTLNDNYSFVSLVGYADKVMDIGLILMVAFLFVTALVVLSNMTRLMEEERGQIACLRTLGYSSFKIIFKYILFAMLATGIGGVCSYFVGIGLAYLICYVFNYSFAMPPVSSQVALLFYLCVFFVIVITTFVATLFAGLKMTGETPANLLRPKPPRAGKKVFLERITFIWNALSFKHKSTMRNVLRYANRFIMTVVSVAVSTALVLAGLALLDICLFGGLNSPSVMGVAFVVIVFAGLLTAVVIYTLTNINISERNRELATLKVLGYHDKEIAGYVYREVYVDTTVGIIFGYPLSTLIMLLLFGIMGMGTIGGVSWFWWLVAPVLVYAFTFIVTLMLKRKIVKIDMNESLKAVE